MNITSTPSLVSYFRIVTLGSKKLVNILYGICIELPPVPQLGRDRGDITPKRATERILVSSIPHTDRIKFIALKLGQDAIE